MKKWQKMVLVFLVTGIVLLTAGCTRDEAGVTTPVPAQSTPARLQTITSNTTLVAFVERAAAYVTANGRENALREFSNPNGQFVQGELYIFAYDFNGTTLAHPVNPEKIGINRLNETQGNVGLFLRNMSAVARNGSGYYRFSYINPAHNRTVESKLGYAQKIDDTWWLGSGVYTGPADHPS
jgi:cytochrome c